jgi:hypothetical protein
MGEARALLARVSSVWRAVARLGISEEPVVFCIIPPLFVHGLAMTMIFEPCHTQSLSATCNGQATSWPEVASNAAGDFIMSQQNMQAQVASCVMRAKI